MLLSMHEKLSELASGSHLFSPCRLQNIRSTKQNSFLRCHGVKIPIVTWGLAAPMNGCYWYEKNVGYDRQQPVIVVFFTTQNIPGD